MDHGREDNYIRNIKGDRLVLPRSAAVQYVGLHVKNMRGEGGRKGVKYGRKKDMRHGRVL